MTKKLFAIIIAFLTILFTSSIIFAEDNNSAGGEWDDSIDKTKNTMHNIGNGVESAISGVMDSGRNMGNNIMNMGGNNGNNTTTATTTRTDNGSRYSAVRTSTNGTTSNLFGLSNMAWTWIIMIIATAVIVSLIYYYGSQFENKTTTMNNKDNE